MSANAIDLCTVADIHAYLGIAGASDDPEIQSLITAASQYWLTRTCRGSLNSVQQYNERYDGNGRDELMLRQWPIRQINSLSVLGMPIPASPDYIQPGYVIGPRQTSLVIIGAGNYGFGFYAMNFECGRLNVAVDYDAGYDQTPADVQEAVIKQVAVKYTRRKNTDQESVSLPQGGGVVRFRSWELPPEVECVIQAYRRLWP